MKKLGLFSIINEFLGTNWGKFFAGSLLAMVFYLGYYFAINQHDKDKNELERRVSELSNEMSRKEQKALEQKRKSDSVELTKMEEQKAERLKKLQREVDSVQKIADLQIDRLYPEHSKITTHAWNEYNNHNYLGAIRFAQECIDKYGKEAESIQNRLRKRNVPLPNRDEVWYNQKEFDEIVSWGPLNDVSTCYFIIGDCHLIMSGRPIWTRRENSNGQGREISPEEHLKIAKKAYKHTSKFPHAMCYDPYRKSAVDGENRYFFWSPAEASSLKLEEDVFHE